MQANATPSANHYRDRPLGAEVPNGKEGTMRFPGGETLEHDFLKDRRNRSSAVRIRQFRSAKEQLGVSRKGLYK
jgi:hypothetical protein